MFRKSSPEMPEAPRVDRKEQSFLQNGVKVQGEMEVAGDLRIEGTVKGGLDVRGVLMIGVKAILEGDLRAREIIVHGTVGGTIRADARIHLAKGAKVKGDLYCRSLVIDEGVHFEGRSHMDSAEPRKAGGTATPSHEAPHASGAVATKTGGQSTPPNQTPTSPAREPDRRVEPSRR
jgi:cytoskeletal protein CcmA (bactofilin family)